MKAAEIMTENVTTIGESTTIGEALQVMEEQDIRHLPVVRGEEVIGMLSDRDLRALGISLVTDVEGMDRLQARFRGKVTDLMTANVITVDPETDVQEIVDVMLEEKISAVPVVDEDTGRLAGIVSYVDVLRAVRNIID
jgi:acetoin utilization protein AcuB